MISCAVLVSALLALVHVLPICSAVGSRVINQVHTCDVKVIPHVVNSSIERLSYVVQDKSFENSANDMVLAQRLSLTQG